MALKYVEEISSTQNLMQKHICNWNYGRRKIMWILAYRATNYDVKIYEHIPLKAFAHLKPPKPVLLHPERESLRSWHSARAEL